MCLPEDPKAPVGTANRGFFVPVRLRFTAMVDATSNQVPNKQWIDCGCDSRDAFIALVDAPM